MKYFVVTDVHSFYDEMLEALEKAGYDPNNPEHVFVSCGDLFDRGQKSRECLDYVMSLPKDRRIFIKGNHEDMLLELIRRTRPFDECDRHNGTLRTMRHLSGTNSTKIENMLDGLNNNLALNDYLNELVNYYQTERYMFVHGWYPWEIIEDNLQRDEQPRIQIRKDDEFEWKRARWSCGFREWYRIRRILTENNDMVFPDEPITVCGHWHTSYGHALLHNKGKQFPDKNKSWKKYCHFEPFLDYKIIALDACTAITAMCNCVVLEEPTGEMLYCNEGPDNGKKES